MKKQSFLFGNILFMVLALGVVWGLYSIFTGIKETPVYEIRVNELVEQLDNKNVNSVATQAMDGATIVTGEFKEPINSKVIHESIFTKILGDINTVKKFRLYITSVGAVKDDIEKKALENNVALVVKPSDQTGAWVSIFLNLIMLAMLAFFLLRSMGVAGGGRNPMSFGKLRPEDAKSVTTKIRFTDVAGADEEKQELVEIVEFLKNPKKFTALGAKIPRGVLLEGPPGTGKTLLAKAVAGEANVPFHSISGSEFVEMFVGVGASRVRDLFEKAKKSAPAIVFIDEIDAVGRRRGTGMGGGNDEREQTLNQLLVEMDGFEDNEGAVIVIAATNRSDVLDPALLRPGRFDRQILVGNPDVKAREAILKVHAKGKKIASDVILSEIAQRTPGFSGADLANLLNEGALIAARRDKKHIEMSDIDEAQDRIIAGPAKLDRKRSEKSNRIVAYHEAGHAVAGLVLDDANEIHKVTIVPRGRAAGYVISIPKEEQVVLSKEELFQRVVGLLAGRTAEELVFNAASTGASDDFKQATAIVRNMVMKYGMSNQLGPVQYEMDGASQSFGYQKQYSEKTAYEIDQEVLNITEEAHQKAKEILIDNRDKLDLIAEKLLEVETMDAITIKTLFETGEMPKSSNTEEYPSEEMLSFEEAKKRVDEQQQTINED